MGLPPLDGAVQETVADPLAPMAVTPVGAAGAVTGAVGVTSVDGAETAPEPTALIAITLNE